MKPATLVVEEADRLLEVITSMDRLPRGREGSGFMGNKFGRAGTRRCSLKKHEFGSPGIFGLCIRYGTYIIAELPRTTCVYGFIFLQHSCIWSMIVACEVAS